MTAGISIPVFVIGCVLLWTPWSNRLSVVLVATFIVSLLSLAYADNVTESLLAARWGIGFGVAAWMLAAVVGFQRSTDFPAFFGKLTGKVSGNRSDNVDSGDAADESKPDGDGEVSAPGESEDDPAEENSGAVDDIFEIDDEVDESDSDTDDSGNSDQTESQS